MTHLYQAVEVYCRTKQATDRTALMAALLQEIGLLKGARAYICSGIKKVDQDRWAAALPFRQDFCVLCDMIISLFIDNGMSETLGQSTFNVHDYTTNGDFFENAAKRVRKFVDKARLKLPPKISNKSRTNEGETAPPANASPPQRLVQNTERPGDLESRPDRTPIEADWIIARMRPFEDDLKQHLKTVKGDRHEACNTANLLVACAFADFMGPCRFMSRNTWQEIVDAAKWFFVRKARQQNKADEEEQMKKVVDLLSKNPKADNYEQELLAALRITVQSKCDRINMVQAVLQEHCRNLFQKHDLDPGAQ